MAIVAEDPDGRETVGLVDRSGFLYVYEGRLPPRGPAVPRRGVRLGGPGPRAARQVDYYTQASVDTRAIERTIEEAPARRTR